jgi:hypothetical protein
MYIDSIDQPIKVGDYVVYAMSGYARIAKILEIKPTGKLSYRNIPEHEITLMTAAESKTFRRTHKFVPWTGKDKTWSLIRIDQPPVIQETLIEQRLARK